MSFSASATFFGSADLALFSASANMSIWFFMRRYHQPCWLAPPYFLRNASAKASISGDGTLVCHSLIW